MFKPVPRLQLENEEGLVPVSHVRTHLRVRGNSSVTAKQKKGSGELGSGRWAHNSENKPW